MKMKILHLPILLLITQFIIAQEKNENFYKYKNQIGINFTNVLGNVLSLNPNNASSPYGLTFRRHAKKITFRSAINFNANKSNNNEVLNNQFVKKSLNQSNIDLRTGLEKHLLLSKKMMLTYGFDLLLGLYAESSEVQQFNAPNNSTFRSAQQTYKFGLGPVLRLEYKISDRLYLSTESSFYGSYSKGVEKLSINGVITAEPDKNLGSIVLELPQSLFINISF